MAQPYTTPYLNLVDVNGRACHLKRLGGQNGSEHIYQQFVAIRELVRFPMQIITTHVQQ